MAKDQSRYRRDSVHNQNQKHISEKDSFSSRSIISSLFSSSVSTTTNDYSVSDKKKNNFPSGKFRGMGCKASLQVCLPCVIKTSVNWEAKKFKKKNKGFNPGTGDLSLSSSGLPDVWCNDQECNDAAADDCLLSRTHVFGRGKVEGEKTPHSHRQIRGEIMQSRLAMERRLATDRYRDDWRLDIDHMSYEELVALTDRIGYVSTGLREDEIQRCVMKLEPSIHEREKKCSICQEEYEANNERGKLKCGHFFHMQCIKLWLQQKNSCPMCKTDVLLKR